MGNIDLQSSVTPDEKHNIVVENENVVSTGVTVDTDFVTVSVMTKALASVLFGRCPV